MAKPRAKPSPLHCQACFDRSQYPVYFNLPMVKRCEWSEVPWTDKDMNFEILHGNIRHMFDENAQFPACAPWWDTGISPVYEPNWKIEHALNPMQGPVWEPPRRARLNQRVGILKMRLNMWLCSVRHRLLCAIFGQSDAMAITNYVRNFAVRLKARVEAEERLHSAR